MPILKQHPERDYSSISNELAQNEELTYEAKGLLIELLSRPKDWHVYKNQLIRSHTRSTKIDRIFKELKMAGYLYIQTIRNKNRFEDRIWHVGDKKRSKEEWGKTLFLE